jgi:hypothetical protein
MSWATLLPLPVVREITGQEADDILATDFGALSLVPLKIDELRAKLIRAGFVQEGPTERGAFRAEAKRGFGGTA